jgi:hypothetical protein
MANTILLTLSLAAEGFLLYVLVQFAREWRSSRAVRWQTTIVWYSGATRTNASPRRRAAKVVPILALSRRSSASQFAGHGAAGQILGGKRWG